MHGAGIISVGLLMDAIGEQHKAEDGPICDVFQRELEPLRELCHWTVGSWDFLDGRVRKWNEVQNTSKDIQMLAMHLLTQYQRVSTPT